MSTIHLIEQSPCPHCKGIGNIIYKEAEMTECDVTNINYPPQITKCSKQNDCDGNKCAYFDCCNLNKEKE